jgi:uncharacterized surface protein with fasciclin (FAS1) repeats
MKIYKLICFLGTVASLVLVLGSCKKPDFESIPPAGSIGTITSYLSNNFDLSLFAAAVKKAGLADSLDKTSNAYTVWAPNNKAFNKEGVFSESDFDKWKPDSLLNFVKTHITRGKLFYSTIPQAGDSKYKNLNGDDLYVSNASSVYAGQLFFVDGVFVQPAAGLGSAGALNFGSTQLNGVVYSITSSIKISHLSVKDFLSSRPDLSTLVAGFRKFKQWDKLDGNGPFTVLAPQDSAFARYDITADVISKMTAADYDPVLFDTYFLNLSHLYLLDVPLYNNNNTPIVFNTVSPDYKILLTVNSFGPANMSASLVTGVSDLNVDHIYGPGGAGSFFLHEKTPSFFVSYNNPPYGNYINYTCSNGVVHLLSQPMVLPSEVKK